MPSYRTEGHHSLRADTCVRLLHLQVDYRAAGQGRQDTPAFGLQAAKKETTIT